MAVALVSLGTAGTAVAGVGSANIPAPSGSGGLLVLMAAHTASGGFNTPSGWNLAQSNSQASGPSCNFFWRASTGGAQDAPTITPVSGTPAISGLTARLSGASLTAPFDYSCWTLDLDTASVTTGTITAFTPIRAGCYQLVGVAFATALGSVTWPTPPNGLGGTGTPVQWSILSATRTNSAVATAHYTYSPASRYTSIGGIVWPDPDVRPLAYQHLSRQRYAA